MWKDKKLKAIGAKFKIARLKLILRQIKTSLSPNYVVYTTLATTFPTAVTTTTETKINYPVY